MAERERERVNVLATWYEIAELYSWVQILGLGRREF